jgi:hypothetical protein
MRAAAFGLMVFAFDILVSFRVSDVLNMGKVRDAFKGQTGDSVWEFFWRKLAIATVDTYCCI